mmetsp:Transcript_43972/g.121675  ORF Transcript_43972/g.121675 Transcript_43972/m.121675 type:complete len:106 (-) Transcript_43972:230-547(-)
MRRKRMAISMLGKSPKKAVLKRAMSFRMRMTKMKEVLTRTKVKAGKRGCSSGPFQRGRLGIAVVPYAVDWNTGLGCEGTLRAMGCSQCPAELEELQLSFHRLGCH